MDCGHAAGPAGAQVRWLMTHLCHKPVAGGGRDSAVQQSAMTGGLATPLAGALYLPPNFRGVERLEAVDRFR